MRRAMTHASYSRTVARSPPRHSMPSLPTANGACCWYFGARRRPRNDRDGATCQETGGSEQGRHGASAHRSVLWVGAGQDDEGEARPLASL